MSLAVERLGLRSGYGYGKDTARYRCTVRRRVLGQPLRRAEPRKKGWRSRVGKAIGGDVIAERSTGHVAKRGWGTGTDQGGGRGRRCGASIGSRCRQLRFIYFIPGRTRRLRMLSTQCTPPFLSSSIGMHSVSIHALSSSLSSNLAQCLQAVW